MDGNYFEEIIERICGYQENGCETEESAGDYAELLENYTLLLKKVAYLQAENKELREKLGIKGRSIESGETKTAQSAGECIQKLGYHVAKTEPLNAECDSPLATDVTVNKHSSPGAKIALFRSFFKGREDVFAKRWYAKTTGKSGYQPVCQNEWVDGLCDKKRHKCAVCPNRKSAALSDADIYNHLAGKDKLCRDVVGIYPMLTDETCLFLCADFDDESYIKDVNAFRKVGNDYDIPVYVERSRSGCGAHAWIFFEEPISAADARKLGGGIISKAMETAELSFKSYDRLFPNQDTLPKGGFGNLVALPLQGNARKNGNSVFVDENFLPHDDQWSYIAAMKKVSVQVVENAVALLCKNGDLGMLADDAKPWESKKPPELTRTDFPATTKIVRADKLYIPSGELSCKAKNAIKRLAAFKNPDFIALRQCVSRFTISRGLFAQRILKMII